MKTLKWIFIGLASLAAIYTLLIGALYFNFIYFGGPRMISGGRPEWKKPLTETKREETANPPVRSLD